MTVQLAVNVPMNMSVAFMSSTADLRSAPSVIVYELNCTVYEIKDTRSGAERTKQNAEKYGPDNIEGTARFIYGFVKRKGQPKQYGWTLLDAEARNTKTQRTYGLDVLRA